MSIDLVVPKDVELTTLLDELRKLSWAAADVLIAYARGKEPPYGFQKSLTVEEIKEILRVEIRKKILRVHHVMKGFL